MISGMVLEQRSFKSKLWHNQLIIKFHRDENGLGVIELKDSLSKISISSSHYVKANQEKQDQRSSIKNGARGKVYLSCLGIAC